MTHRVIAFALLLAACLLIAGADAPDAAGPLKTFDVAKFKITLVRLEAGEFQMGSPADEAGHEPYEQMHTVKLTKPFFIGQTEVTQWQYEELMGENPSVFKGGDLPVENVSWTEAVAFCQQLSRREGKRFRLPTEAEWEYAARAGSAGPTAGGVRLDDVTWYADNSGGEKLDSTKLWIDDPKGYFGVLRKNGCKPRPVTLGRPNAWGLYHMQGNVTEWVEDFFDADYYTTDAAKLDPAGPAKSDRKSRVMRGGNWGSDPAHCRIAHREWNEARNTSSSRGFRIVMEAD